MSEEQRVPSKIVVLREADGETRLVESKQVDFTKYKFLKSGKVAGMKVDIDEWCHEDVFDVWAQALINELWEKKDGGAFE